MCASLLHVVTPTSRLLELLELLQSRPLVTGHEIAAQLGVDPRTVRRYVDALQELGIPVEGQRGVGGGYRMRPGYRLPPLMLERRRGGRRRARARRRAPARPRHGRRPSGGALEKIHRVLPATLRRRVEALEATLAFTAHGDRGGAGAGATLLLLADAIRRRRRLRTSYTSFSGRAQPARAQPVRARRALGTLVPRRARPRPRRAADVPRRSHAPHRDDPDAAPPPPDGFDAVAHVSPSLASVPVDLGGRGVLDVPLAEAAGGSRRRSPSSSTPESGRCCACASTRSTGWPACSRGSAVTSRSSSRPSSVRACGHSRPALRPRFPNGTATARTQAPRRFAGMRRLTTIGLILCVALGPPSLPTRPPTGSCRGTCEQQILRLAPGLAYTPTRMALGFRVHELAEDAGQRAAHVRQQGRLGDPLHRPTAERAVPGWDGEELPTRRQQGLLVAHRGRATGLALCRAARRAGRCGSLRRARSRRPCSRTSVSAGSSPRASASPHDALARGHAGLPL